MKNLNDKVYDICEKRWNETHHSVWINGNMKERIELYQKVKRELLHK